MQGAGVAPGIPPGLNVYLPWSASPGFRADKGDKWFVASCFDMREVVPAR